MILQWIVEHVRPREDLQEYAWRQEKNFIRDNAIWRKEILFYSLKAHVFQL